MKLSPRRLVPIIGYILIVVVVFGRALLPPEGQLIFGDDIHRSYYFFIQYLVRSVRDGIIPFWNPYMFSGTPFLANPITNAFYPVNWLFFVFPAGVVYPFSFMLHLLIAMSGMYVLISNFKFQISNSKNKDKQERREHFDVAAWVAGVVFGLSSFFSSRVYAGHIDVISAASYMPWVVFFFLRAHEFAKPKYTIIAGSMLALQLFAGYHTMTVFTLEAVGIGTLFIAINKKSLFPFLTMIKGVIIGVGLAAVILLPIQQFVNASIRTFEKPYVWSSHGSLVPDELVQLISPFALGDQYTYRGSPPNYWEHAVFIGRMSLIPVILGVFFFVWKRKRNMLFLFALVTTVLGLWLSLGNNAPLDLYYFLWRVVPLYHFLRIPSRHLLLVVFGLSIFVGFGLQSLRNRWLQGVFVFLLTLEMIIYARHFIGVKELPEVRHDAELIQIMQKDQSLFRVLPNFGVWVEPRNSFDFDSVMGYRIFSTTGYDSTLLRNYYEFIDAANGVREPSIRTHDVQVPYLDISSAYTDFLNIKYILVPTGYDPLGGVSTDRFTPIREDRERDYRLYKNASVLPRFFLVSQQTVTGSREETARFIRQGNVDLTKTVLADKSASRRTPSDPHCDLNEEKHVAVTSYQPNRIELSVRTRCDAFLVSSEVMYPGWEARIDGKKEELFEGNMAFRALFVPKGEHTVVMRYNPKIFLLGGLVSFGTLVFCLLWIRRRVSNTVV